MAIRSIKKGEITCDACKNVIATIRASAQVFAVVEAEAKYTETRCMDCSEKPIADNVYSTAAESILKP